MSLTRRALAALVALLVAWPASGAFAVESDDPLGDRQWGLDRIRASEAWRVSTGRGATIAVVDTGLDLDHPDLQGRIERHVSCIGADDDPGACTGAGEDDHGHGTHVAGIAAATTGNGRGVASVAPEARLWAVRVLKQDPPDEENPDEPPGASGDVADIRAGIRWAADRGADVINLSLGEPNIAIRNLFGSGLEDAIEYAWSKGAIPVIAAGNRDFLFASGYAGLPALVVTATNPDDEKAGYATAVGSGSWGLAAPGGEGDQEDCEDDEVHCAPLIVSTWIGGVYAYAQGTSMAAPHVSGAAASLRALGLSPQETVDRLLSTAKDIGTPGDDSQTGHGLLDVAAAVNGLAPAGPNPFRLPGPTAASPQTPTVLGAEPQQNAPVRVEGARPSGDGPATTPTTAPETTTSTVVAETPTTIGDAVEAAVSPPGDASGSSVAAWGVVAAVLLGAVTFLTYRTRRVLTS